MNEKDRHKLPQSLRNPADGGNYVALSSGGREDEDDGGEGQNERLSNHPYSTLSAGVRRLEADDAAGSESGEDEKESEIDWEEDVTVVDKCGEASRIFRIAWPIAVGMFSTQIMATTDVAFVGRLGVSELASASLANMVIYGSFVMVTGLANALTTLSSNAVGAGSMKKVGLWLRVAVVW